MSFHCPAARGEGCRRSVLGFGLYTQLGEHWVKLLAVTVLFQFPSLLLVQRLSSSPAPFNIWTVNQVKMRDLSWSHRLWLLSHPCGQAKGWGGPGCWGPAAACPCFPSCYTRRACLSKCLRGRSAHPQLPEDGHQGYSKTTHGSGCRPSLLVGCHLPQPWGVPTKLGASSPLPMSCLCRRRALPDGRSPQTDPEPAGGDGECPSPGMLGSLPGHGLCWCCS